MLMKKIEKGDIRDHEKASEEYIDVIFTYGNLPPYFCSVPIKYRRTGTDVNYGEIDEYLENVYEKINPEKWNDWKKEQNDFWKTKPRAYITKGFFDILAKNFDWCCVDCTLPKNRNWARRT